MFDVIGVGDRCAGAATALLLARKGFMVLVVDKARFQADIQHGHFIQRQGPRLLQRWGVLGDGLRLVPELAPQHVSAATPEPE